MPPSTGQSPGQSPLSRAPHGGRHRPPVTLVISRRDSGSDALWTKDPNGLLPLLGVPFAFAATPAGERRLPPEVLLDQLLLRTDRLIEADDLDVAVGAMEESFALGREHELAIGLVTCRPIRDRYGTGQSWAAAPASFVREHFANISRQPVDYQISVKPSAQRQRSRTGSSGKVRFVPPKHGLVTLGIQALLPRLYIAP